MSDKLSKIAIDWFR